MKLLGIIWSHEEFKRGDTDAPGLQKSCQSSLENEHSFKKQNTFWRQPHQTFFFFCAGYGLAAFPRSAIPESHLSLFMFLWQVKNHGEVRWDQFLPENQHLSVACLFLHLPFPVAASLEVHI
jgi:hypothetical protein